MSKPVTTQEMFDLWTKMVNPGAYPLQSLMFPVLDPKELEKKIAELRTVEHWLKANLNMLQLTVQSLECQRAMVKGGEKFQESMREAQAGPAAGADAGEAPKTAMWAWDMMARAGKDAMQPAGAAPPKPKRKPARKKAGGA